MLWFLGPVFFGFYLLVLEIFLLCVKLRAFGLAKQRDIYAVAALRWQSDSRFCQYHCCLEYCRFSVWNCKFHCTSRIPNNYPCQETGMFNSHTFHSFIHSLNKCFFLFQYRVVMSSFAPSSIVTCRLFIRFFFFWIFKLFVAPFQRSRVEM